MANQSSRSGNRTQRMLDRLFDLAMPLLAVLAAMTVGALLLILLGVNPFAAYGAMFKGALGSVSGITQTLISTSEGMNNE